MEFHCHVSIGKASRGQNSVGRCAYIEGEKLTDELTGQRFDHTSKEEVVFRHTYLCDHAPKEWADQPQKMWSKVQDIEMSSKSNNPQLYREFEISLPNELSLEQEKKIVDDICAKLTADGMCCTAGIHQKDGNHHVHIMTPLRRLDEHERGRFLPKSRTSYKLDRNGNKIPVIDKKTGLQALDHKGGKRWKTQTENLCWNKKEYVKEWREMICTAINKELSPERRLDHRSYKERGINRVPGIHHYGMESRKEINAGIKAHNERVEKLEKDISSLQRVVEHERKREHGRDNAGEIRRDDGRAGADPRQVRTGERSADSRPAGTDFDAEIRAIKERRADREIDRAGERIAEIRGERERAAAAEREAAERAAAAEREAAVRRERARASKSRTRSRQRSVERETYEFEL